jgi:hypothetical protein
LVTIDLILKSRKIACIGSRNFRNEDDEKLCKIIGYFIASKNIQVASGNAEGCDQAYAKGANEVNESLVHLYLVNENHNKYAIKTGNQLYYTKDHPEWVDIARRNHPTYKYQSEYVQNLFNRNVGIILNSNLVIALPNSNKASGGGTGHGIRVAEEFNIPVLNLLDKEVAQSLKIFIKSNLLSEDKNGKS